MDAQEFRRLGYQLVDWIADYREHLERLPVMSQVKPGEIRADTLPGYCEKHEAYCRGGRDCGVQAV